jgi:hypothetical protein
MKKIALLILIAIAGCTAVEMPHICKSSNRKNYKIRTSGEFNGYSIEENDIIEGKTRNANYKRLLISDGEKEVMTRYAYDVEKEKNGKTYTLRIWHVRAMNELFFSIKRTFDKGVSIYGSRTVVFPLYEDTKNARWGITQCCYIHLNCIAVTMLDKKGADAYLKEHPETVII